MKDGSIDMEDGSIDMEDGSIDREDGSIDMEDGSIDMEDGSIDVEDDSVDMGCLVTLGAPHLQGVIRAPHLPRLEHLHHVAQPSWRHLVAAQVELKADFESGSAYFSFKRSN